MHTTVPGSMQTIAEQNPPGCIPPIAAAYATRTTFVVHVVMTGHVAVLLSLHPNTTRAVQGASASRTSNEQHRPPALNQRGPDPRNNKHAPEAGNHAPNQWTHQRRQQPERDSKIETSALLCNKETDIVIQLNSTKYKTYGRTVHAPLSALLCWLPAAAPGILAQSAVSHCTQDLEPALPDTALLSSMQRNSRLVTHCTTN
jgi:hypothetical protein